MNLFRQMSLLRNPHPSEWAGEVRRLITPVSVFLLVIGSNCHNNTLESPGQTPPSPSQTPPPPTGPPRVPLVNKIIVVIGENEKPGSVIGNADAPYINSVAAGGALFVNSFAVEHPSQPNYLDLFSGADQGVTNDDAPSKHFTTPNLADELIQSGKTFATFCEDMPSAGFDGAQQGLYARKHNPVANWVGSGSHQVSSKCSQPFTVFPHNFSDLPDVSFVIPNLCNDGHNSCAPNFNEAKQFDLWIKNNLDSCLQWCVKNNSLLIITFDEDDDSGGNKISTIFSGAKVRPGSYADTINHFNVLRTMEESMGLHTHAGKAASAKPITSCWK